jgi:hypothetical protein
MTDPARHPDMRDASGRIRLQKRLSAGDGRPCHQVPTGKTRRGRSGPGPGLAASEARPAL